MADPVNDPFAAPPSVAAAIPPLRPPPPQPAAAPVTTAPSSDAPRRSRWPMLAGAAVVLAAVVVGVVVITGGDDDGSAGGAPGDVHLVTFNERGLTVSALDGSSERRVDLPDEFSPRMRPVNGRWLIGETDGSNVTVIDLSTGDDQRIDLGDEDLTLNDATVRPGSDQAIFASQQAGPVVAVDLASGDADQLSRGDHRHVFGGANSEVALYPSIEDEMTTLVVPLDRPGDAWEVPGRVLDVSGERTLVAVRGDDSVTISTYDGEAAADDGARVDTPLAGGLLTDDGALVIDTGGAIFRVDTAGGDKETVGTLGFGVDFASPVASDRLFVLGSDRSALVDAAGTVVVTFDAVEDGDGEPQALVPFGNAYGTDCIILQPGSRPYDDAVASTIVRLTDGETIAQVAGSSSIVDAGGCSAIGTISGALSIDGETIDLDGAEARAVAPDRRHVVAIDRSGDDPQHLMIDLDSGERTDLEPGANVFAVF